MGVSSSKKHPGRIVRCSIPPYCIRMAGSRHIIIGGGGGASKTGVVNEIQTFLLTFNHTDTDDSQQTSAVPLKAVLTSMLATGSQATMNMDIVSVGNPELGKYLLAAGHDQYCDFYISDGFSISDIQENETETLPTLRFDHLLRITSVEETNGAYQKTVRFDRSIIGQPRYVVTGGGDGKVRVWDVDTVLNKQARANAFLEISAHDGVIDEVGIASDARTFLSLGSDAKVYFWDMSSGKKLAELPSLPEFGKEYRVRTIQFTSLGSLNIILVAAYNQVRRTSKSISYLTLWAFNRERLSIKPILVKKACSESISTMTVSDCGNFTAIGTMSGSVGIYDTHEMKSLYFARETHGIFVTGLEFLPRKAIDFASFKDNRVPLPGIAASYKAAVLSLSADNTVQFHIVPYRSAPSLVLFAVFILLYLIWYFSADWFTKRRFF